jgi:hypothetical protein
MCQEDNPAIKERPATIFAHQHLLLPLIPIAHPDLVDSQFSQSHTLIPIRAKRPLRLFPVDISGDIRFTRDREIHQIDLPVGQDTTVLIFQRRWSSL